MLRTNMPPCTMRLKTMVSLTYYLQYLSNATKGYSFLCTLWHDHLRPTAGHTKSAYSHMNNQADNLWSVTLMYLHVEEPHWLCQPASMSLKMEQLHLSRNHTTFCTMCCVSKGRAETALSYLRVWTSCSTMFLAISMHSLGVL